MQLDPLHLGKVEPMITGLPLQNKLRTYRKKEEKKQRQSFF